MVWWGMSVLTCFKLMLRSTQMNECQSKLQGNVLVSRSVTKVFHNGSHKVAGGGITAKVSCPYLGCVHTHARAHTHTHAHTHTGRRGRGGN